MKKVIFSFFAVLTAVFFTSCDHTTSVTQKMNQPETYCHTELVYSPLATSVVAVPYRVQDGDKVSEIVERHKTDPNQVGGPFLDYTEAMFLADNPDVVSTTERSIRKDKCDPTKIDTVWYKKWNLKENNLVYLRVPARIDTVETPGGLNVAWFSPEKTSPIRHIIERTELLLNNINPKPVTNVNQNVCPNDKLKDVSPQPIRDAVPPVCGNLNTGAETPWWVWIILVALGLIIFLLFRKQKANNNPEDVLEVIREESEKTRHHVSDQNEKTRAHVTHEVNGLRIDVANKLDNIASNSGTTNELLAKILENGTPKKPDDEQK